MFRALMNTCLSLTSSERLRVLSVCSPLVCTGGQRRPLLEAKRGTRVCCVLDICRLQRPHRCFVSARPLKNDQDSGAQPERASARCPEVAAHMVCAALCTQVHALTRNYNQQQLIESGRKRVVCVHLQQQPQWRQPQFAVHAQERTPYPPACRNNKVRSVRHATRTTSLIVAARTCQQTRLEQKRDTFARGVSRCSCLRRCKFTSSNNSRVKEATAA